MATMSGLHDIGDTITLVLKSGEVVRGMIVSYDEKTTVVREFDANDNFIGERRIIKNDELERSEYV